jgi:hypothetical protein
MGHPETCEQGRVRHSSLIPSGANWFHKALFAEHNWCSPLLIHNDFFQQVLSIFQKKYWVFVFPGVNSTTFSFFKALPIFDITKLRVKTLIAPVLPTFDSHH